MSDFLIDAIDKSTSPIPVESEAKEVKKEEASEAVSKETTNEEIPVEPAPILPKPKKQRKNFGVWLRDGFKALGATGPYIRLQSNLALKANRYQTKKRKILSWIARAIFFVLVLFFVFILSRLLVSQGGKYVTGELFMIVVMGAAQLAFLVYSISMQTKRLYKPDDLRIISVFPLSTFQRYFGEVVTIFIRMIIMSGIIFWPILLMYGIGAKLMVGGVGIVFGYIFSSLFAAILAPILPFGISLIISMPFMLLSDKLRNKSIIKLVIFIILFAALLIVYAFLLNFMTQAFKSSEDTAEIYKGIKNVLVKMNRWYNPSFWTSMIAVSPNVVKNPGHMFITYQLKGWYVLANFAIYIGISFVLIVAGMAITKPLYNKFASAGSTLEGDAKLKTIKIDNAKPFKAIFVKEIKQIIRTPAYAYFYLGVAASTPVLCWLIADVVKKLGSLTMGESHFFGYGLLIIMIIVSLIGSYSANIVSREGKEFYITKVAPISFRKQLMAKMLVNIIVSFGALLLCTIAIGATSMNKTAYGPGLTWPGLGLIFGISFFFLIGVTFNGVNIEMVRPRINTLSGENNESNTIVQLGISLLITIICSLICMTLGKTQDAVMLIIALVILACMIVYALVNFLVWFFTAERKYWNIEIR